MFNDTVTIYNKYRENGTEKWQQAVLYGVFWNENKGAVMRKTGVSSADTVQIIIPRSVHSDKEYISPKAWASLEDKSRYFTLQSGDTIVKGCVNYDIQRSSSELTTLDGCHIITNVDNKDFGGEMAHFEVVAK